jgi:FHA domain-containing protein
VQGLYAAKALKVLPPVADELVLRPLVDGRLIECLTPAGGRRCEPATTLRSSASRRGRSGWRWSKEESMSCVERGPARRAKTSETRSDGVVISISVTSYNGGATAPLSGHFDETGGNIGRGENNQLVLPDPERTISRVHAQVVFRNGRYAIIDRGSNPISVNGRPSGQRPGDLHPAGRRAADRRLRDARGGRRGDRRRGAADPFADFPGLAVDAAGGRPRRTAAGLRRSARRLRRPPPHGGPPSHPRRPPAYAAARSSGRTHASGIPQDWDPFAPDPKTSRTARPGLRALARPAAGGGGGATSVSMSAAAPRR